MCGQLAGHAWGMNARQPLFSIHTNQLRSCISHLLRRKLVMGWGRACASEAARIYVTPSQSISMYTCVGNRIGKLTGLLDQGPTSAHTASHVVQANWRPTEDVGNHDQRRSGAPLRTVSLRLRTMENGLGESLVNLRRTVESGLHLSEAWSAHLVMPA